MAVHWRFQFFGSFSVRSNQREITRFRTQKTAALLALLAIKSIPQRREELCAALWPDAAPEQARNSLSAALSALRREMGDDALCADRFVVGLTPHSYETDLHEFDLAISKGHWSRAIELYNGHFLPGFHEDPLPALAGEAEEKARGAFGRRLEELEKAGAWAEMLALTRRSLTLFGDDEHSFSALMRAHSGAGDKEAALRVYEDWQRWARRENDLVPDAARHLARQLRRDLAAPTENAKAPAPITTAKAEAVPQSTVLPQQWTRFFGRGAEIQTLTSLLKSGERLITLTGGGGTGKTRLSLEIAAALTAHFDNRVFFVPLAALFDPALLLITIRDALGLPAGSDLPPAAQIARELGDAPVLLVLDNFEQLVEGGSPRLQTLREAMPQAQLLVSSRILLGLPGEREWSVQSLSAREARELFIDRAGGRWAEAEHRKSVDELCTALEDLPLAIELAAARAALLTPSQILERLNGKLDFLAQRGIAVEPRHRSLRATIEWSIDLLDKDIRGFFLALSTFRDGWTLEAATAVAEVDEIQALDWLAQLREHSLITTRHSTGEARFRMLLMLREWAQEQLDPTEKERLRSRHFDYYLQFIERRATPQALASQDQNLVLEVPNFRAALEWVLQRSDAGAANEAARLCAALFPLWDAFSQFLTGREWMGRTLRKMNEPGQAAVEPRFKAPFLAGAGFTYWYCGDFLAANSMLEESVRIAHDFGDDDTHAFALSGLSRVVMTLGRWEAAYIYAEAGLTIARRLNNPVRLINCLVAMGWSCHNTNRHPKTRTLFRECFEVARSVGSLRVMSLSRGMEAFSLALDGDPQAGLRMMPEAVKLAQAGEADWFCAFTHAVYGILARECGHLELARRHSPRAAREFARIGTRWETSSGLTDCGMLAIASGEWVLGAHLLGAAQTLRENIGHPLLPSIGFHYQIYLGKLEDALSPEEFAREWNYGRGLSLEEAMNKADAMGLVE